MSTLPSSTTSCFASGSSFTVGWIAMRSRYLLRPDVPLANTSANAAILRIGVMKAVENKVNVIRSI